MIETSEVAIPSGERVFVDANIIYYYLADVPALHELGEASRGLLRRVASSDLEGHTVASAAADAAHKIMLLEATQRFGESRAGMAHRLNDRPDWLSQLRLHQLTVPAILEIGIAIHPTTADILGDAARVSTAHGILTNDAIIVATMQRLGIEWLATNDTDFDRVPWVKVWKPSSE